MGEIKRVVLDSNVWVALFLKKTLAHEFSLVMEEVKVYISKPILIELSRVLTYPRIDKLLRSSGLSAREILELIIKNSELVRPKSRLKVVEEDPADNKILECALEAGCDLIVSGDKHLLKLREFRGIQIVSPRQFLDSFR